MYGQLGNIYNEVFVKMIQLEKKMSDSIVVEQNIFDRKTGL